MHDEVAALLESTILEQPIHSGMKEAVVDYFDELLGVILRLFVWTVICPRIDPLLIGFGKPDERSNNRC